MNKHERPIGIFYEHPNWFKPLFHELELRGIPFIRIQAQHHQYNPSELRPPFGLLVNRMSPSAFLRGNGQGILHTINYLEHLERLYIPVINGSAAQRVETSKAKQLSLLASLQLRFPKTRIVNHINQVLPAAFSLRFPILIKANVGGSGAGIVRFNKIPELQKAVELHQIPMGIDNVALVQEYIKPKDNFIVRVEVLNGRFLYAIKVHTTGDTFNLCPADLCHSPAECGERASSAPAVESYLPNSAIIKEAERIAKLAGLDVGGVEYLTGNDDNQVYFYDINALSNFVANPEEVIGFNPYKNFVEYIEHRNEEAYQNRKEYAL
ncbi:MAG: hypothetical protein KF845_05090 [Cyclobacteriaceae bacterium]|nr:hypothetical protein [Cyclobacteriaceae bacterium]